MTCAQGLLRLLWGGGARSWSATALLIAILCRKRPHDREDEGETNPTEKKKKTDGPDETQSGSTATTSKVQVEQIATEIQSADSVTSDT